MKILRLNAVIVFGALTLGFLEADLIPTDRGGAIAIVVLFVIVVTVSVIRGGA